MITVKGKYNTAKVYTDNIEGEAIAQIEELCNQEVFSDGKIRIMPDVHYGKGCVIGFTADLGDKVIPNIVGVDIGCGMYVVELGKVELDLEKINQIINNHIPSGKEVNKQPLVDYKARIKEIRCLRSISDKRANVNRFNMAVGSLGGGNHFIEINVDSKDNKYLVIHSGSRNLGKRVADYYQDLAIQIQSGKDKWFEKREEIIRVFKEQGKKHLIQAEIERVYKEFEAKEPNIPKDLCFLTGKYRDDYLHDMNICQEYAKLSRETMAKTILEKYFGEHNFTGFHTIHNYINYEDNIIRKGSVSAKKGEKLIIPINMRDGSIIAVGKGNEDWNNSAPHGAGRLLSRAKAKKEINMNDYMDSMKDVFSTSVNESTLDEAPMAYKPMQEILDNIEETVEVLEIIRPIYNFKDNN